MRKYIIWSLILLPLLIVLSGCVKEIPVQYSGLTKTELMERARSSFLGLGLRIIYDDEKRGIIQAVKETAGGSSGYIIPISGQTYGGFSSKPPGVSDYFSLTVYDNEFLLRIDGDTGLITDIVKRIAKQGGSFTWGDNDPHYYWVIENGGNAQHLWRY